MVSPAAVARERRAVSTRDEPIMTRRPRASESVPEAGSVQARAKVENDRARLAVAGETPNSTTSSGSSGCTV
jgi:hypothetical protein